MRLRRYIVGVKKATQLCYELARIAEVSIDGCEPYVGYLVELLELLHHESTHFRSRDFFLSSFLENRFGSVRNRLERGYLIEAFRAASGDMERMTELVLGSDHADDRHRLTVRMNQLGLKVTQLKMSQ